MFNRLWSSASRSHEAADNSRRSCCGGDKDDETDLVKPTYQAFDPAREDTPTAEQRAYDDESVPSGQDPSESTPVASTDTPQRRSSAEVVLHNTLQSFEDQAYATESQNDVQDVASSSHSSSSTDSEQERLNDCAASLYGQQKKVRKYVARNHTHDEAQNVVYESMSDQYAEVKRMVEKEHHTGGTFTTASSGGVSMGLGSQGSSKPKFAPARTSQASCLTNDPTLFVEEAHASVMCTMSLITPKRNSLIDGDDDEEDENGDPDDEKTINRRYGKRYGPGFGVPEKAQELRRIMEASGVHEPGPAKRPESKKDIGAMKDLEITFVVEDVPTVSTEDKVLAFPYKPLGIKWNKRAPITIATVREGSLAAQLGVKPGWIVKQVGHIVIAEQSYARAFHRLMDAVEWLPTQVEYEASRRNTEDERNTQIVDDVLAHNVKVTLESALGFHDDNANHFIVVRVLGKPHSQIQTRSQCVNDTPDTDHLEWFETHELFDFEHGDTLEFAMYARDRPQDEEAAYGEDTSLGRARMPWEVFHSAGFHGPLTLRDPQTGTITKTQMQVRVEVEFITQREQMLGTYSKLMRGKLQALGIPNHEIDADLASLGRCGTSGEAVRRALLIYHRHSAMLGQFMPFPGRQERTEDMDEAAAQKLQDYTVVLDDDVAPRLWTGGGYESEGLSFPETPMDQPLGDESTEVGHHLMSMAESEGVRFSCGPSSQPTLKIKFRNLQGDDFEISFSHRPLGITFSQRTPITIEKVKNGVAKDNGVEKGWKILAIQGAACDKMKYSDASKLLYGNLEKLPETKK